MPMSQYYEPAKTKQKAMWTTLHVPSQHGMVEILITTSCHRKKVRSLKNYKSPQFAVGMKENVAVKQLLKKPKGWK